VVFDTMMASPTGHWLSLPQIVRRTRAVRSNLSYSSHASTNRSVILLCRFFADLLQISIWTQSKPRLWTLVHSQPSTPPRSVLDQPRPCICQLHRLLNREARLPPALFPSLYLATDGALSSGGGGGGAQHSRQVVGRHGYGHIRPHVPRASHRPCGQQPCSTWYSYCRTSSTCGHALPCILPYYLRVAS
jgi:hypothetical protein